MRSIIITTMSLVLFAWAGTTYAMQSGDRGMMQGSNMMDGGMMMGGGMMVACIVLGVLAFIALVLAILALIKYLRSKPRV